MGALLMALGFVFVVLAYPADGLTGVASAAAGVALLWAGYVRVIRRGGDR